MNNPPLSVSTGYELGKCLYTSGRTRVFRAYSRQRQVPVILKFFTGAFPYFQYEYELQHSLNQLPGVVQAYELVQEAGQCYMVLEDFGGESLERLNQTGRWEVAAFLELALKITRVIGQLHDRQVMHKDINPANLVSNPQTGQIKLIDFGIAASFSREAAGFYNPNLIQGRLPYISPEQTGRMNRVVDYRTDLYALGVTLYELLTGTLPFHAEDALGWIHRHLAGRPVSPLEFRMDIPPGLADIILKLLEKNADDRYQSAFGLQADLEFCLQGVREPEKALEREKQFTPGREDFPASLQVSQQLYGREAAKAELVDAFDASRGRAGMILLAGSAGVGKTVLARELYQPVTRHQGYFVAGKFEQSQRGRPYLAIVQAFGALLRYLLAEEEARLAQWRECLRAALGQNLTLLVNLLPELGVVTGEREPAESAINHLREDEMQNRFVSAFQTFVRVFADAGNPLVVFLDDLQWADGASLRLLEQIMPSAGLRDVLLLGAYRDNETGPEHPLHRTLAGMKKNGVEPRILTLQPLSKQETLQLVADSLHCPPEHALSLAGPVYRKTGGNPFFINTFLASLTADKCLSFDRRRRAWVWDPAQVEELFAVTDNVVEMLLRKLQELPPALREVLQVAACLGNRFEVTTLAAAGGFGHGPLTVNLDTLVRETQLLVRANGEDAGYAAYAFAHDRIQQAACALLDDDEKTALHYRIGRHLVRSVPEIGIFEWIGQLNLGIPLIADPAERNRLAEWNLTAGKKAKSEMAHEAALRYLQTGIDLLEEDAWDSHYALSLALYTEAAEAAWQNNEPERMHALARQVERHARNVSDQMSVYLTRLHAGSSNDDPLAAIEVGLQALALLGIRFPDRPTPVHILWEYLKTRRALRGKKPEDLLHLPPAEDPLHTQRMRFLARLIPSVHISTKYALLPLLIFKQVQLSVRYGNTPESALAYAGYGIVLNAVFNDIEQSYAFGEMASALAEQREDVLKAPVYVAIVGYIKHWKEALGSLKPLLKAAFMESLESGNLEYMSYGYYTFSAVSFYTGRNLEQHEQEMRALSSICYHHYSLVELEIMKHADQEYLETAQLLQDTAGPHASRLTELQTLGGRALRLTESHSSLKLVLHTETLLFSYLFGAFSKAEEDARQAETHLHEQPDTPFFALFYFYSALTRLALLPLSKSLSERLQLRRKAAAGRKKLRLWAKYAPMNYRHKYLLVEAEWQRVHGRPAKAAGLYEQAIAGAAENGFLHEQGLACEAAARFYLQQNNPRVARTYLYDAREAYRQWGAALKIRDLESRYPALLAAPAAGPVSEATVITTNTRLNLDTLLRSLHTVASEIVPDKLIQRLMQLLLGNAGATKGVLLFAHEETWYMEATGRAGEPTCLAAPLPESGEVPVSLLQYVTRTGEALIVDEPAHHELFGNDAYFTANAVKSALCLPLVNQGRAVALAYLENDLTGGVFTPAHLDVLRPLCAQAAISLENARLYGQLDEYSQNLAEKVQERTRALEEAHQTKMRLLSAATHDLRQPIYALGLFLATMEKHALSADLRELVGKSQNSLQAKQKLFDGLMNISLLESGEIKPRIVPCHLQPLLRRLDREFAGAVEAHRLQWVCEPCEATVQTDSLLLERILRNLLENAIKYTEHGEIALRCRLLREDEPPPADTAMQPVVRASFAESPGIVAIEVNDTGIGIAPDQVDKIFLEFYRVPGLPRQSSGLGLGLAIIKHLTELLGHALSLHSEPGRGTRFVLQLPLAQAVPDAVPPDDSQLTQQTTAAACVLLIGDDSETIQAMQALLEKWDYQVVSAHDDYEALRAFEQDAHRPDVIVVDYRLRCGSGIQAIRRLRQNRHPPLPAILYGTAPDTECFRMAEAEGLRLLPKPVKPAQLLKLIRYYLRYFQS